MLSETVPNMDEFDLPRWVDTARWEALRNRLADEFSRNGSYKRRLLTEINEEELRLDGWLKDPSAFSSGFGRVGQKCRTVLIAEAIESSLSALDSERATNSEGEPPRVETSVVRDVGKAINRARKTQIAMLLDAPSGIGKTEGEQEYIALCRKTEGFDCPVWLIELDEFCLSQKAILTLIARQCVGVGRFDERTEFAMSQAIENATVGRKGVLIIDEAQHLGDANVKRGIPIINGLRRLVDKGCFGLVLAGNGEIYRRLSPEKQAQLTSRLFEDRIEFAALGVPRKKGQPGLIEADVDAVMAAWGVHGIEERKFCIGVAKKPGALRVLCKKFRKARYEFNEINFKTLSRV